MTKETTLDQFLDSYIETEDGYKLTKVVRFYVGIFPLKDITLGYTVLTKTGYLLGFPEEEWDGASGGVDTTTNIRSSFIHDRLIKMIQAGLFVRDIITKIRVDFLYFMYSLKDQMRFARAMLHFFLILINPWHKKVLRDGT